MLSGQRRGRTMSPARAETHTIAATIRKNHLHPDICPPLGMSMTIPPNMTPEAPAIEPDRLYTVNALGSSRAENVEVMRR